MQSFISELSTEELLKGHSKWKYARVDRNGTRIFNDFSCPRCGGTGYVYSTLDNGTCWECFGSGSSKVHKVMVYTPAYGKKLEEARSKRAEERHNAEVEKFKANINTNLQNLGFGIEGTEAVIYRVKGDTFKVKEQLKAAGCRFNQSVGWFCNSAVTGFDCQRMTSEQLLEIDYDSCIITWKQRDDVKELFEEEVKVSTSDFVGQIGQKILKVVVIDRIIGMDTMFGTSFLHIMSDDDGNVYTWATGNLLEQGTRYLIRGTVKNHTEYNGVKQTALTRCKTVE